MSDYEGDWEPVSSQVNSFAPVVPPEPTHYYIVPKGTSLLEAQEAARQKPRRPKHANAIPLPASYRPALQKILPRGPFIRNGNLAPADAIPKEQMQKRVFDLGAYKRREASPEVPDAIFEMMHPWEVLVKALPKQDDLSAEQYAADRLAEICLSTDAFIAVPDPKENVFRIWGTPGQTAKAQDNLRTWEMHIKGPGKSNSKRYWTKQNAVDGREEDRLVRRHIQNQQHETFQHFADDIIFPFEAHLLWPEGYDLLSFIDDYDASVLEDLRHRFDCNISHNQEGIRATKIGCEDQAVLFQVYARLMGLMKEMIAQRKRGMHIMQCRLPTFEGAREHVQMSKAKVRNNLADVPELTGNPFSAQEAASWKQLSDGTNRRYHHETKTAIRSCIKSLHVSQKHVRMRISFGKIALTQYILPANGVNYELEEFIPMMRNLGVQTIQLPLLTGVDFKFVDALDQALGEPELFWAVHFDFTGAQGGVLRLEREFAYNIFDPHEPSVSATRWLDYGAGTEVDASERLQLDHIDLENVGYQIHIGAATIYNNAKAKESLRSFENNVSFKPSLNGLRFKPSKHAIFPPGNTELSNVEEVTIARYNFKNTKGTLEIRRKDVFPQRFGQASSVPIRTEWHAHYFYREWDNLMAEFANVEQGEDVQWPRDIQTFFPKIVDEDHPKSLPQGFRTFMKEVQEIQDLLKEVLQGSEANIENDLNGTKK